MGPALISDDYYRYCTSLADALEDWLVKALSRDMVQREGPFLINLPSDGDSPSAQIYAAFGEVTVTIAGEFETDLVYDVAGGLPALEPDLKKLLESDLREFRGPFGRRRWRLASPSDADRVASGEDAPRSWRGRRLR